MATGTKKRNHSPTISASVHPAPQWSVDKTTDCHRGRPLIPGIFPIPPLNGTTTEADGAEDMPGMKGTAGKTDTADSVPRGASEGVIGP